MPELTITGYAELQVALKTLPEKVGNKFTRHALKVSGELVLRRAKYLVPVKSRALQNTLRVGNPARTKTGFHIKIIMPERELLARAQPTPQKAVTVLKEKGYYPMALEFGKHGVGAHPYMRPAIYQNRGAVIDVFSADLKASIDDAAVQGAAK